MNNAFKSLFYRAPDMVLSGPGKQPYLRRWWVIPRNRWLNIYLHHFLASDDDRALHDHPWHSLSLLLRGGYIEHQADKIRNFTAPAIIPRSAICRHRLELIENKAAWTLFITGPWLRVWGFWLDGEFIPHSEFESKMEYRND